MYRDMPLLLPQTSPSGSEPLTWRDIDWLLSVYYFNRWRKRG